MIEFTVSQDGVLRRDTPLLTPHSSIAQMFRAETYVLRGIGDKECICDEGSETRTDRLVGAALAAIDIIGRNYRG